MSKKLINVVLDIETLSLQEDAAILQIGCCVPEFDLRHIPTGANWEFQATVNYEEAMESEFYKSAATLEWWDRQDPEVRKQVFSGQDTYLEAVKKFAAWIATLKSQGSDVAIWGNGSDFDNRLLTYTLGIYWLYPWDFRNNRDLRTLRALCPIEYEVPRLLSETRHTALGDARYEARIMNITYFAYPHLWSKL